MTAADATEVVPWLTSACTIVFLQRWLKSTKAYQAFVGAVPGADEYAHWLFAGTASLIAALGIHVTWNWDAIRGGQVLFAIPSLWDLFHGVGDWFKVYILQATIYETHRGPEPAIPPDYKALLSKGTEP